jgi:hypothetical protein
MPFWKTFAGTNGTTRFAFALVASPDSLACFRGPEEQFVLGDAFDVPTRFADFTASSVADSFIAPTACAQGCSFKVRGKGRDTMFTHTDIYD